MIGPGTSTALPLTSRSIGLYYAAGPHALALGRFQGCRVWLSRAWAPQMRTLHHSVRGDFRCRGFRVLGFTPSAPQALAPATTVDAGGERVPAVLVRLQREAPSGAALLAANARLHWGSGSGAHEPAHRRAPPASSMVVANTFHLPQGS